MFEISAKKGLCYVICGSEVKTSDLAAHFHTILALQIQGVSQITLQTKNVISPEMMLLFPQNFHCITGRSYLTTY